MSMRNLLPFFLEVSSALTGFETLNEQLAELYLDRLLIGKFKGAVPHFLRDYAHFTQSPPTSEPASSLDTFLQRPGYANIAQEIVVLWYLSTATHAAGNPEVGPPEQYFSGLLWQVLRAHPPALSGGYYGYWRYPPEA